MIVSNFIDKKIVYKDVLNNIDNIVTSKSVPCTLKMFGIKQFSLVLLLGLIVGIKSSTDLCSGKCLEKDSGPNGLFMLKNLISRLSSFPHSQRLGTVPTTDDVAGCKGTCSILDDDSAAYLAHEDCTKFCKCDFGTPYVFQCPAGLHFNPELRVCDRPSHAGCAPKVTDSTTPRLPDPEDSSPKEQSILANDANDASGCKGKCPIFEDDTVAHLAHEDCTKFCKCDFGTAYVFECPNGLHFNPKLEICDRPSHAGCTLKP